MEFKELSSLNQALQSVCSLSSKLVVPAHSPFVWLAAGNPSAGTTISQATHDPSEFLTSSVIYSQAELVQQIFQCSSVSRILILYPFLKF